MTRETKLGLLVGLAFIIAFGILISNYISSTNQPPAAALRVAADNLRSGLGQPGSDDVAPVLRVPQAIEPQQTIVTTEELNHHDVPPVRFVPQPQSGQAITPAPVNSNEALARIRNTAQQQGEEVVPVNTTTPDVNAPVANNTPQVDAPTDQANNTKNDAKTNARSYEAQPGDSLGAIALKAYGSSCRANRQAIIAANPSLADDPDLIVAGRTYIIPALGTPAKPTVAQNTREDAATAPAATAGSTYVVKPHDTLWSIAINEVGTPSAVAAIEDLNRDVLNGSDRVRPNMKLTLPTKKTE